MQSKEKRKNRNRGFKMLGFIAVCISGFSIGILITSMIFSIIGVEIMSFIDFDKLSK